MRFQELQIQTRRERPSRVRTEGEAFLIRAGYLNEPDHLTPLGKIAVEHIRGTLGGNPTNLVHLGLAVLTTAEGGAVFEDAAGGADLLRCANCGYVALLDMAKSRKPGLPSETLLPLERVATPDCTTIESLSNFLGVPQSKTAKAMLYAAHDRSELVFVVLRGDTQVSERKLRAAVGELTPATPEQIVSAGAVPGYASPVGLRRAFVVVDELIPEATNLVAGANESGYHLRNANYGRDYQAQKVADLTLAHVGEACIQCGSPLAASSGFLLADQGAWRDLDVLKALAEQHHDERGLRLPLGASPFDVYLLNLPSRTLDTKSEARKIHQHLETHGISVLLDDRDERAGVKFNDADLIGCPLRLTVGERQLENRMVEFKRRSDPSTEVIPIDEVVTVTRSIIQMPR